MLATGHATNSDLEGYVGTMVAAESPHRTHTTRSNIEHPLALDLRHFQAAMFLYVATLIVKLIAGRFARRG